MVINRQQRKKVRQLLLAAFVISFSLITLWLDISFVPHWWELWPIITLAAGIFLLRPLLPKHWQK